MNATPAIWERCDGYGWPEPDAISRLARHLEECPNCRNALQLIADTPSDDSDALIAQLRLSATPDPYAAEPECQDAVARVAALLDSDAKGPPPQPAPERLGEYCVREIIGRGGMGTVYRATHARLGRDVALKVLPPHKNGDPAATARFHREMAALGQLDHPNVVRATDAGEAAGVAFLVMELAPGIDAARLFRL